MPGRFSISFGEERVRDNCGAERFRDSALAAETLQKMGYENVRSIAGGLKAWKAAGLQVTK